MKARVKWVEDVLFVGESGTGHTIVMDGPEEAGGHGTGMRPMELLLLGLGGCTSFDVIDILKKSRQDVTIVWLKFPQNAVRKHQKSLPKFMCTTPSPVATLNRILSTVR